MLIGALAPVVATPLTKMLPVAPARVPVAVSVLVCNTTPLLAVIDIELMPSIMLMPWNSVFDGLSDWLLRVCKVNDPPVRLMAPEPVSKSWNSMLRPALKVTLVLAPIWLMAASEMVNVAAPPSVTKTLPSPVTCTS